MASGRVSRSVVAWLGMIVLAAPVAAQSDDMVVRIAQTSSAGSDVYIIDPEINEVVGIIPEVGLPHGVAMHADKIKYYITNEHDNSVDVIDARTLRMVKRIELAARPNELSTSALYRKVYVAIAGAPLVQVIDMDTDEVIANIPMAGGVHNTFTTPDGKHAVAGMLGAETLTVIDAETDKVLWSLGPEAMTGGVRPMAFETNPDGSTKSIFVNVSNLEGFLVVDFAKGAVVRTVRPPALPVTRYSLIGVRSSISHGLKVMPDGSSVWGVVRAAGMVYGWTLPDLEFIGGVPVGTASWLTVTPDSRYLYVAVTGRDEVAVVDVKEMQVVARIPVGKSPKRVETFEIPADIARAAEAAWKEGT